MDDAAADPAPDDRVWPLYIGSDSGEHGPSRVYFSPRGYLYTSVFDAVFVGRDELGQGEAGFDGGGWPTQPWQHLELEQRLAHKPAYVLADWDERQFDETMHRLCELVGPGPDWGSVASRLWRFLDWEQGDRYDRWVNEHPCEPYNPHLWPDAAEAGGRLRKRGLSEIDRGSRALPDADVVAVVIDQVEGAAWSSLQCDWQGSVSWRTSGPEGMANHRDDELARRCLGLLETASAQRSSMFPRAAADVPSVANGKAHVLTSDGWLVAPPGSAPASVLVKGAEAVLDRVRQVLRPDASRTEKTTS